MEEDLEILHRHISKEEFLEEGELLWYTTNIFSSSVTSTNWLSISLDPDKFIMLKENNILRKL